MYEVDDDTYCYPGTAVLENKLDIRDQKTLDRFETEMTDLRSLEPLPGGSLNEVHYKAIHRHLFQDVYTWAGKFRTVRISKGGNPFCFPEHIRAQMKKLFKQLSGGQVSARPRCESDLQEGRALSCRAQCHSSVPRRQRPDSTILSVASG